MKATTATATSLNKRFNEENNGSAVQRGFIILGTFLSRLLQNRDNVQRLNYALSGEREPRRFGAITGCRATLNNLFYMWQNLLKDEV